MPGVLHSERLWPSPATWLLVPLASALVVLALLPLGTAVAGTAALLVAAAAAALLVRASPRVEVSTSSGLRAGRAVLPGRFVAGGEAARGARARDLRGPRLDARTHLCLRGWVDGVVLVELDDPQDPTPAWLVSSRRPEDLLAAVLAVSGRAPGAGGPGTGAPGAPGAPGANGPAGG
ncbi:DUF3093 domain-containing protein [Quadrisphaera sp. DSM 44207]|uniref:DUF3093 domain-containing protein n=1 Tax=Quadrisphaera sp. DSM 44207 TaxID=1881057 RepID=UPI0008841DB4|nr:DUF3093 domain-containing protein [Quadrisphaera sp. DSM 44207]SDQ50212.1 Protein of unknown function [Quadrisphaera sp. DSM 44207]